MNKSKYILLAAFMLAVMVFQAPLGRLLSYSLEAITALIQGLLGHALPNDPLEAAPLDLLAKALIPFIFMLGMFLIISFLYHLFFGRGRSFGEILRIERTGDHVEPGRDRKADLKADWRLLSRIVVVELMLIFLAGFAFNAVQSSRYSNLNYRKYSSGIYHSPSQDAPQSYSFVMVRKAPGGKPLREVFFTLWGDMTIINYKDGKWTGSGEFRFSTILLGIAAFLGIALVIFSKVMSLFSGSAEKSENAKKLIFYGAHVFIATLLVIAAKGFIQFVICLI